MGGVARGKQNNLRISALTREFVYGGGDGRTHVAGGRIVFIRDFMAEVHAGIRHRKVNSAAIPEEFPHLRTLQFAAQYWNIGEKAG